MTVATMTLAEFLTARLDEDEQRPRGPLSVRWHREVEAKRAIVAVAADIAVCEHAGFIWQNQLLAHLAAVYCDHPDYREEWRP